MNKLILTFLLTIYFIIVQAQEADKSSNYFIGGSMNFVIQNNTYPSFGIYTISGIGGIFSNTTDDTKNTRLGIYPYIGKNLNPNLSIGIQVDFQSSSYKALDVSVFGQPGNVDYQRKSNQIGLGLFLRNTINPGKKLSAYVQPSIAYNNISEDEFIDSNLNQEEQSNYIEIRIGGGLLYNFNQKLRANLRIGALRYINGKWEIKGTDTEKTFSSLASNFNLANLSFGLELRL